MGYRIGRVDLIAGFDLSGRDSGSVLWIEDELEDVRLNELDQFGIGRRPG